jgi:hypothetical protein
MLERLCGKGKKEKEERIYENNGDGYGDSDDEISGEEDIHNMHYFPQHPCSDDFSSRSVSNNNYYD